MLQVGLVDHWAVPEDPLEGLAVPQVAQAAVESSAGHQQDTSAASIAAHQHESCAEPSCRHALSPLLPPQPPGWWQHKARHVS